MSKDKIRKPISKRIRFEVFKRDSFKCQYCGQPAPDVLLEIDHIIPVSKGGKNDIFNLLTSCEDCNAGKSNISLEQKDAIRKQKAELDRLQERRGQIEMMAEWRQGLIDADNDAINKLAELWAGICKGRRLNENGRLSLRKLLRTFNFEEVAGGIQNSCAAYFDGTEEGAEKSIKKIGGCARMKQICDKNPEVRDFYRIRGICRKRFRYVPFNAIQLIRCYYDSRVPIDAIYEEAGLSSSWTNFTEALDRRMP